MPTTTTIDGIWCASIAALLAPFTTLLVAHRIGNPPLTERLLAAIYRRAGGRGLAAIPFLCCITGYGYVSAIDLAVKSAWRRTEMVS